MKNDEYINKELENATTTAENEENIAEANEETADFDGEDKSLNDEISPVENGDEAADEPSLFDEKNAETISEPSLFDEENAETISEPPIFDEEVDTVGEPPLLDGDDSEAVSESSLLDEEDGEVDFAEEPGDEYSDEDADESITDEEAHEEESTEEEIPKEAEEEALPKKAKKKASVDTEKPRRVDNLFDFIELFVFTLAAVFIITSFFFRYSIVDGGSMQNTLEDDEALILRSFLYTPKCGDVVVVQDKSTALKDPIVKRVIAVGGQTVKFTRDAVYVDGVELDEPYVYTADYKNPFGGEDIYRYSVYPSDALLPIVTDREDGVFYEITVPDGEIFVMGDHRNSSKDSRDIGTLHEDAVIGKVVLRFLPFTNFGKIE